MSLLANIRDILFDRPYSAAERIAFGAHIILYQDVSANISTERTNCNGTYGMRLCIRDGNATVSIDLSPDAAFNVANQIKDVVQRLVQQNRN